MCQGGLEREAMRILWRLLANGTIRAQRCTSGHRIGDMEIHTKTIYLNQVDYDMLSAWRQLYHQP